MGPDGLEKVVCFLIDTARVSGTIKKSSAQKVIVDTTVAPKAIAYPSDSQLYLRSIKQLVSFAKKENISLRQTYERLAPRAYKKASRLFYQKKSKAALKEVRRLKTYCARIYREILRVVSQDSKLQKRVSPVFFVIGEILMQEKVYSLHEPRVECIAKGKAHKKYEFGNKVSLTVTHREGFVIGIQGLHGNPYDGHTLPGALAQAEKLTGQKITEAFVDKGYKGHGVTDCTVYISGMKKLSRRNQLDLKRRQAIEPHIGHMKTDGKLGRNFLKGIIGDQVHALLCGMGHNMRMLANFIKRQYSCCPA